ncbi:EAL domain-containing protein [Pseudomonas sp. UL073]|uniref:EAL domain-containing protein n=1 Tax=Zestomonas insulae TaxID=2809017 RepID=A0ABS2IFS5_9GAMM|nr:EAL domain-containing protein [Pseudomonas insulae]MBM7061169.1 EAL domain-containing protein [Pseudomonas insulae]
MKSHTDAVSRLTAEVVTQLPVPNRLGMLRFERLNEASWALLFLDPTCERELGLSAGELCSLIGAPYASLMEPDARYRLHEDIQQQLLDGPHYRVHYTLHTPAGSRQLMELGEAFKQHGRQLLRGYLMTVEAAPAPLSPPGALLATASQDRHLFQRAVEQSSSAFLLVDRDGLVEYVNPSFTAITLYSADEVRGRRLSELPALENLSDILFDAQFGLAEHNSWQGEFRSRRKNLEPYWGQLSISKVYDDEGELTHYIGIYEDITDNKLAQQRIERLAYTDNLTRLGNRPSFIRSLEQRFARDSDKPFSLLLVDIDNFKRINDSLGHQTGDKLLVSLAKRLRNSLSANGSLARFASNEFAVLLDDTDLAGGQALAAQLLHTLDKPLFVDNQLISITGSVGLACAPQHGDDPQTLMKHAGLALHKAKANGKHQAQVFTEALNAEAHYKLFVENNLRRALTQNELEVFYQPKLCLKSGQLRGMEALLRWNHPEKGMIRPDQFISVAEETGLIIPIGKWVARQACRMSKQLSALGLGHLQVAINLSPKQFSDPDLIGSIASILHEEQLAPHLLELELTESLLLDATDDTRHQLSRLKSLGLSLAMDDFGTGYSSLSYLKKFPIDVIKIDRSFIKDIPDSQDDMEITSAVIAMAHNLKLKVVAEGIESPAQLAFLRRHKCDVGQGYLFDQPIAGRELMDNLRRYPCRN